MVHATSDANHVGVVLGSHLGDAVARGEPLACSATAVSLDSPLAVDQLPGFRDGLVSVQDAAAQLANPVWHIHGGKPPESRMVVPFSMLLNLASVAAAEDKSGLWGFIRRYAPEASPETHPDLDQAAEFAVRYFRDFVAPERRFRLPTEQERAAIADLRGRLAAWDGGLDAERQQAAEKQVREGASPQTLPFPDFAEAYRRKISDTLDYPPEGSHGADG